MGPRRALVREVNPHLICVLCRGYFIEATTIVECLHSFCRSCLVKYLECSKFCPICDVQLHKNNPLLSVRCDTTLQQLVYKLIPGLYSNEMSRRRKYYSELGGPSSSSSDTDDFPVADAYYSPEDSISLSLEFMSGKETEEQVAEGIDNTIIEKMGLHRRYLQCPAAVTMSHLKKFLRMKYSLNHDHKVDIIYAGESLTDDFSLMDVAYTFSWNKITPMRFKYRFYQKTTVKVTAPKPTDKDATTQNIVNSSPEPHIKLPDIPVRKILPKEESIPGKPVPPQKLTNGSLAEKMETEEAQELPEKKTKEVSPSAKRKLSQTTIEEPPPQKEYSRPEPKKKKSSHHNQQSLPVVSPEPKVAPPSPPRATTPPPPPSPSSPPPLVEELQPPVEETREEEDDGDRNRTSPSGEENTSEEQNIEPAEPVPEPPTVRSEERRKERKKSKKGKHHHHHRHHDRKSRDSPPAATILHSSENDIMKLKVKLTAIKTNCNSKVTKYTVVEDVDDRKESTKSIPEKTHKEEDKQKHREEETKMQPEPVNNKAIEQSPKRIEYNNIPSPNKEMILQVRAVRHKVTTNGPTVLPEQTATIKMPPSSITVSKITAEEKRQMEQQKLLSARNGTNDSASKRPSLEIMLVNAPNKVQPPGEEVKPTEVKKTIRPTPPSIPLVRLSKNMARGLALNKMNNAVKSLPPQQQAARMAKLLSVQQQQHQQQESRDKPQDDNGALDLSEKSSRKSPEAATTNGIHGTGRTPAQRSADPSAMRNLMTLSDTAVHVRNMMAAQESQPTLKIPVPGLSKPPGYQGASPKPLPNQSVRQIPNPSALLYRQHLNGRTLAPPPVLPLSSLRKMETMTRNIEKVAAGLSVKAAVEAAGYGSK